MEYIEGFEGILNQYESRFVDRRKLIQYYVEGIERNKQYIFDNEDKKWIDKYKADVLKTIRKLNFFCRFNIKRQRELMDVMKV